MLDPIKSLLEFLPVIREAPTWLRALFVVWVVLTAALGVAIVVVKLLTPPIPRTRLSVDLSKNQYIPDRQVALQGGGLAEGEEFKINVRRKNDDGSYEEIALPADGLIRGAAGAWRFEWVMFGQPGPHEIEVQVFRNGRQVDFLGPYSVQVGDWVHAPTQLEAKGTPPSPRVTRASGVDLSAFAVIYNQGDEGSSPSFAFISAMETALRKKGVPRALSARYLYEKAKQHDESGSKSEGTYLTSIVYVAEQFGVPPEAEWPYQAGVRALPKGVSWSQLDASASHTKAITYRLQSLDEIQSQLELGHPVVAGIKVYRSSFYSAAASSSGEVTPPIQGDMLVGSHAIAIVGYDPENGAFRFANSWGSGWGDEGFGNLGPEAAKACLETDRLWAVDPVVTP